MIDPLKALRVEIDKYDFKADPEGVHAAKILTILDHTLSHDQNLRNRNAPLDIVIYALQGISYPSFVPELMSDFLHLLTMVEFHRLCAVEKASEILEWHIFYSGNPNPAIRLNAEDETYIRDLMEDSNKAEAREFYTTIIFACCQADLERLWMQNSNADFWIRWGEYMSIFKADGKTKQHRFHYKLSDKEISKLSEVANSLVQFMEDTVLYAGEREGSGLSMQDIFQTSEFRHKFKDYGIVIDPAILEVVECHLDYVQNTVRLVEAISTRSSMTPIPSQR